MNEIAKVKREVQLKQWAEIVQRRSESGLPVTQWCAENNITQKIYYYRLKKVREAMCKLIPESLLLTRDLLCVGGWAGTENLSYKALKLLSNVGGGLNGDPWESRKNHSTRYECCDK